MTQVSLRGIRKSYGSMLAVDDVSLEIGSGEFICLLGASGCGKTTLLRMLGGFTEPDRGEILADGKRVDGLPPNKREVGFVFQSYALFPTKTVAENIGFGLAVRRRGKAEIAARVAELAALVRLEGLTERYPHELSGGQQQRVALARALAPAPTMLLLDEPLSALDAKIRAHLRAELRAIVDRLRVTTVYVTHDQEEALSMADRVAVMDCGRLVQVDAPVDIYTRPRHRYVADFVGTSNMLPGRPLGPDQVAIDGVTLATAVPDALLSALEVIVSVRPEHVLLSPVQADDGPTASVGTVQAVSFAGSVMRARVQLPVGDEVVADVPTHEWVRLGLKVGDPVRWRVRDGALTVLPTDLR